MGLVWLGNFSGLDNFSGTGGTGWQSILIFQRSVVAEVIARDFAAVFSVDHGVGQECPFRAVTIEWMLGDVSACWVYLDLIHMCLVCVMSY